MAHKCIHWVGPAYLHHKFLYISDLRDRQTMGSSSGKLQIQLSRLWTEYYKQSFEYSTVKLWNTLPPSIRMLNAPVPFFKTMQYCENNTLHSFCIVLFEVHLHCFLLFSFCCNYCIITALL